MRARRLELTRVEDRLAQAHASNLRGGVRVIPADKQPTLEGSTMLSITIKRSAATLGVVAGLLAAAGPAGAAGHPASTQSAQAATLAQPPAAGTVNSFGLTFEHLGVKAAGTQVGSEGVITPPQPDAAIYMHIDIVEGVVAQRADGTFVGNPD